MVKRYLIITSLLLFAFISNAQRWNQRKYEFYYGIGATNFICDIGVPTNSDKDIWIHFFNTMGFSANTGLRYNIKDRHFVRGSLYLGQLYASDVPDNPKYYYRGYTTNSFFTDLTVRYEFLVLKEKSRRTIYRQLGESKLKNFSVPTYLFVGIGGVFNAGTLQQTSGETKTTNKYVNVAPVATYGFGLKFRINRLTYFNVELSGQTAFNDGLDGAKGSEYKFFGEWIDQYQLISFNLIHKLRSNRNGLPKFKKR